VYSKIVNLKKKKDNMFTKQQLQPFKKNDLIQLLLNQQIQQTSLNKKHESLDILQKKFDAVHARLAISENTSSLLVKRVGTLEVQLHASQQYSRRKCLEISGIAKETPDENIEKEVCQIIESLGIDIDQDRGIQACHRIGPWGTAIAKFTNRKTIGKVFSKKGQLKD
jgi:hypothetical protein